jgi:hypothetical protein
MDFKKQAACTNTYPKSFFESLKSKICFYPCIQSMSIENAQKYLCFDVFDNYFISAVFTDSTTDFSVSQFHVFN